MQKIFVAGLVSYIAVRHLLPKKEYMVDYRDPELLTVNTQNCILFDQVETWYDLSSGCRPISSYHWRRIQLTEIP
jgi:hypothetical protein